MKKFCVWRSNMRLSVEDVVTSHKSFTVEEVAVILSIIGVYKRCFDWAAFELLRIGDHKYRIVFQRVTLDLCTIKIEVL